MVLLILLFPKQTKLLSVHLFVRVLFSSAPQDLDSASRPAWSRQREHRAGWHTRCWPRLIPCGCLIPAQGLQSRCRPLATGWQVCRTATPWTGTETGTSKTVLVMDMEATAAAKALYLPLPGLFAFVRPLTYLGSPSLDACYHVL